MFHSKAQLCSTTPNYLSSEIWF